MTLIPLRKAEEVALNKRYGINAGSVSFNDKGWFTVVPANAADNIVLRVGMPVLLARA
jgi:hypothetical protein